MQQSSSDATFDPRVQARNIQQGFFSVDQQSERSFGYDTSNGEEGNILSSLGPRELSFAAPSTEQRRNVTKRRSNSRARDSVDSTSVPISSLLSRKPKDRTRDSNYEEETLSPRMKDVVSSTSITKSPDFTRRQIPTQSEDFDLH